MSAPRGVPSELSRAQFISLLALSLETAIGYTRLTYRRSPAHQHPGPPPHSQHASAVTLSIPGTSTRLERGTCTRWRRICNAEHEMLTNSCSRQRVCLARNAHSGKAVVPALHVDFAGSGFCMSRPTILREETACRKLVLRRSSASTGLIGSTT